MTIHFFRILSGANDNCVYSRLRNKCKGCEYLQRNFLTLISSYRKERRARG